MSSTPPIEIRIHGRGGQGTVVAAYLLAASAIRAGLFGQAFPAFGAERRGAPVTAFVRFRGTPIMRRCEVERPLILIIQDQTLLNLPSTTAGLASGGGILVNTGRQARLASNSSSQHRVAHLAATAIAESAIGRPIPNVPLLGALISLMPIFPISALFGAIEDRFDPDLAAHNRRAAEAAAQAVEPGSWQDLMDRAHHAVSP